MGSLPSGIIILSKMLSSKIQWNSQLLHVPWSHSWKELSCILLKLSRRSSNSRILNLYHCNALLTWGIFKYLILFHFTLLHFTDVVFFFYKLKVCGNSTWNMSIGTILPIAFAHFVSLSHILVIPVIFQTFSWSYLYCIVLPYFHDWICDQWSLISL